MPPYALTDVSVAVFVVIPLTLAAALTWGAAVAWRRSGASRPATRRAAIVTALAALGWMAITGGAAASGLLADWHRRPPPFAVLMAAVVVIAGALAFSPLGRRLAMLPLWALVGVQGFRFPLELAMHRMYERGIMPGQMSYSGFNFDIVSGLTALGVAIAVWRGDGGARLVAIWNLLGLALLANIVAIAMLSTPAVAYFGPDHLNVWVALAPFVWLPAVMVLAALAGHLIIFRALSRRTSPDRAATVS